MGLAADEYVEICFVYIVESSRTEYFKRLLLKFRRDFDILPESLGTFENLCFLHELRHQCQLFFTSGAINSQYYLESGNYVPERMTNRIDRTTSLMTENGLYQFYLSLAAFKQKFVDRAYLDEDEDDFQALTMGQLKRPMILLFCLWAVAMTLFMAEVIISKWKNQRDNNPH